MNSKKMSILYFFTFILQTNTRPGDDPEPAPLEDGVVERGTVEALDSKPDEANSASLCSPTSSDLKTPPARSMVVNKRNFEPPSPYAYLEMSNFIKLEATIS